MRLYSITKFDNFCKIIYIMVYFGIFSSKKVESSLRGQIVVRAYGTFPIVRDGRHWAVTWVTFLLNICLSRNSIELYFFGPFASFGGSKTKLVLVIQTVNYSVQNNYYKLLRKFFYYVYCISLFSCCFFDVYMKYNFNKKFIFVVFIFIT